MAVTKRTISQIQAIWAQDSLQIVALDSTGDLWIKSINPSLSNLSSYWQRVEPIEVDDANAQYPVPTSGSTPLVNTVNLTYNSI